MALPSAEAAKTIIAEWLDGNKSPLPGMEKPPTTASARFDAIMTAQARERLDGKPRRHNGRPVGMDSATTTSTVTMPIKTTAETFAWSPEPSASLGDLLFQDPCCESSACEREFKAGNRMLAEKNKEIAQLRGGAQVQFAALGLAQDHNKAQSQKLDEMAAQIESQEKLRKTQIDHLQTLLADATEEIRQLKELLTYGNGDFA